MQRATYACGTAEHAVHRRGFLGAMASSVAGSSAMAGGVVGGLGWLQGRAADAMQSRDMRVLVFNMHGGLSQLESWDPKPGTKTGGPCRAIPTSVPGTHISELLPYTAKQMHHLCMLRGVEVVKLKLLLCRLRR